MSDRECLEALASVLAYPQEGYAGRLEYCRSTLAVAGSEEARGHFDHFREKIKGASLEEMQEEYTRTFDLDPSCSLEVGWHLFGENYTRGEFLVSLRRELRTHGVEEGGELPDHLTHVLPVLGRMEPEQARGFVSTSLLPALDKMLAALDGREARYEGLLQTVRSEIREFLGKASQEVVRG